MLPGSKKWNPAGPSGLKNLRVAKTVWKEKLAAFAREFEHPAWGYSHFERVYQLSLHIAGEEKLSVDREILDAAALLHDIGALPPYRAKNELPGKLKKDASKKIAQARADQMDKYLTGLHKNINGLDRL